jgi:hypothetical protein
MDIEFKKNTVELNAGEMFVAHRGVEHNPLAEINSEGAPCNFEEKFQSLSEITGCGIDISSPISLESKSMDLLGHSNATIMTSIPVNDNKQPPNAQYNSSYASGQKHLSLMRILSIQGLPK